MKKLIIAGGRDFDQIDIVYQQFVELWFDSNMDGDYITEVVSGGCKGADLIGEELAEEFGIPIKRFPADWKTHGKAAGPIKNEEMAKYATDALIFWDGNSKGTKNMINLCEKYKLNYKVISYEPLS